MTKDTPLLEVESLSRHFPGVLALDGVNLRVEPGQVHALVGENGAGKSTLIKILAGADRPDAGSIRWQGEEVTLRNTVAATRLGISVIHQDLNLVPNLSVAENVMLGLESPRRAGILVDWRQLRARARAATDRVGADFPVETPVRELSQAQRVLTAIARALVTDARLIIMDEPTAALSAAEADQLHRIVRELAAAGTSVIYVSHRLDEVLSLASQITVFKDGKYMGTHARSELADKRALTALIVGRQLEEAQRRENPRQGGEPLVVVDGVSAGHRLTDVSLELRAGEVVGLAGLVGSGRSELARIIFGADRPDSGTVRIKGQAMRGGSPRPAIRQGVAMLPEDRREQAAVPGMSVRGNMTLASMSKYRRGPFLAAKRERKAVGELIRRFRTKVSDMERPIRELSGGNQQKVVVSRWVDRGPDVLIFDEPTQGVDVGAKGEILGIVGDLADEGCAVLFISSEIDEVVQVSDRIVVLQEGKIVTTLQAEEITRERVLQACYGEERSGGQKSAPAI